jgi:O-antigen/teichoic acid export membrane protein
MPSSAQNEQPSALGTTHLKQDLKGRAVRGGVATISSQAGRFLLQTASTVLLARLLTPRDYGLVAMVVVVTGFADQFKDLGLSMATVQRREISHAQISVLFWVNALLGCVLGLLVAASAPILASFYNEPALAQITPILSLTFFVRGLGVQHTALLRRAMRFNELAMAEVGSTAAGVGTAIALALKGYGYWALVWLPVVTGVVHTILVWYRTRWCPGAPQRGVDVRELLSFGGYFAGFNIINYFVKNSEKVVLGWHSGAGPLGLYNRAYSLLMLPLSQITAPVSAVAVPTLRETHEEPARFKRYYLKGVHWITYATAPLMAFLIFYAEDLIRLLLGEQWLASVPIFQVLAAGALFRPLASTTGWLFITSGRADRMFRWRLASSWVSPVLCTIGVLKYGVMGAAYAKAFAGITLVIPAILYARRSSNIAAREILAAGILPIVAAMVAALGLRLTPVVGASVWSAAVLYPGVYIAVQCLFSRGFEPIDEIRELWQILTRKRKR